MREHKNKTKKQKMGTQNIEMVVLFGVIREKWPIDYERQRPESQKKDRLQQDKAA